MDQHRFSFEYQENPTQEDQQTLLDGLNAEAARKKGMSPVESFAIFIKDEQGTILGGVNCVMLFGSLYIDMLWLQENLRHKGLGKRLMLEAEKEGRKRGCLFLAVNTMDYEALPFYKKLGYEVEFTRKGYEKGSTMYLLRKEK